MIAFVYSMNFDHTNRGRKEKERGNRELLLAHSRRDGPPTIFLFFFSNLATFEYMKRSDVFFFFFLKPLVGLFDLSVHITLETR